MAELVFYTNPMSRGRIVRWMLEEMGIDYTTEIIAYGLEMQTPDYRAINPMAKVPAIRHGEIIITEGAAICAYLADAFPAAGLAPPQEERGAYYRWLFFGAGCLDPAAINHGLGVSVSAEQEGMVGYRSLTATLDALEWRLGDVPYLAGDAFTAADVYVGQQLTWGIEMQVVRNRPVLEGYVARLKERPANRRATRIDSDLAARAQT